jgi:FlaA1/EpsC-like NDP-sugar epimerase
MADPRIVGRGWYGGLRPRLRGRQGGPGLATLIIGAGSAARTVVRDLRSCPDYGLRPAGFLDDDPGIRSVFGTPVLGTLAELRSVVRAHQIQVIIIAIPSMPQAALSRLIRSAAETGAHVRFLPSFLSALERAARVADMRTVSLSDLLGRAERRILEPSVQAMLCGARVLVTGAGGSIGQELCRQIRSHDPESLYMLDHDESNVHTLELELNGQALLDSAEIVIADIRDETRIRQVFRSVRPDVIFHAAAHKHLPLLERNPCEGVKTNVLGTQNVVRAAAESSAARLLLISTDKAAEPRSILGATKRLAEMVVQAGADGKMHVCSVRFGNVLGSRGSLLAVVAEQIERGEPVTVTDPDVTRFFMTVEEAVGLVLSAAPMGEFGETFVLDMGDPVRIVDLVRRYAELLRVPDVQIDFTGLRPGEKLHETLFGELEQSLPTVNPAISATRPSRLPDDFTGSLDKLYRAADDGDDELVRTLLGDLVQEYHPVQGLATSTSTALAMASPYPDEF